MKRQPETLFVVVSLCLPLAAFALDRSAKLEVDP